jgi:predicted outer membrane lipoprotein
MQKTLAVLVAAMFAFGSVNALAAKHMAADKDAKKPTAEECKKDPKMAGCEQKKEEKK